MSPFEKTEMFLRQTGMHPDAVDLDACLRQYVDEMECRLRGEASTLAMLPMHICRSDIAQAKGEAVAVDMGGTNLRIAWVRRDADGTVRVDGLRQCGMPGVTSSRLPRSR